MLEAAAAAGLNLRLLALDVTDEVSIGRAFAEVGELDVLVNNAGIMWFTSLEETDLESWRELFDTNLFGAVRCMRAALPMIRARGGGCIVNVSSAAGMVALAGLGPYAASKAALESVSETTAIEARAHGIRVVIIETGATATPIAGKFTFAGRESPYWGSMRNTVTFMAAQNPPSSPAVIADAIARAVSDPATSLRVAVGQGSAELISARSRMNDDEWIDALGGTRERFLDRYHDATGLNLR